MSEVGKVFEVNHNALSRVVIYKQKPRLAWLLGFRDLLGSYNVFSWHFAPCWRTNSLQGLPFRLQLNFQLPFVYIIGLYNMSLINLTTSGTDTRLGTTALILGDCTSQPMEAEGPRMRAPTSNGQQRVFFTRKWRAVTSTGR